MWSIYRKSTSFASFCNIILGLLLICLWASCFHWCLSRLNAANDLAAPLWVGVMCVLVGSFGIMASCLYWKRTTETLLSIMTSLVALSTAAAVVLSVHASFKEYQLYESQGRPPANLDEAVVGVVFFGVMAVFSFVLFLISVTWACACLFRRCGAKVRDEQEREDADLETFIVEAFYTARSQSSSRPSLMVPRRPSYLNSSFDLPDVDRNEPQPKALDVPSSSSEQEPRRNVGPRKSSVAPGSLPLQQLNCVGGTITLRLKKKLDLADFSLPTNMLFLFLLINIFGQTIAVTPCIHLFREYVWF